ncbi:lysine/arginine permease, variant 2 [Coprinopsis cinerea AmutBmut pab1-1]|nr:lysine/arginine permease, variant 2 [Coprinopsis cinerea AmutBmut pab1-1]
MGTVTAAIGIPSLVLEFGLTHMLYIALISAEMSAFKPVGGGFVRHAAMWIDRSAGIVIGWNFWYSMAVTMPAEISAATTLLGFWNPNLTVVIPLGVLWFAITLINLGPVRLYGEFEFYFAFIKVAFIVLFIISGFLLDLGVFGRDSAGAIGLRYWSPPYPLIREYIFKGNEGRLAGFWSTMISAAFAYGNVQVVAIAGAETRNPRKTIPAALKTTFIRVVFLYVVSVFVISILVPADDRRLGLHTGTATQSPFVIALSHSGIKALPSLCNGVIFLSAVSSANACTFLASRTLHGMALDCNAPRFFLRLNRYHVPYIAVLASAAWGVVSFLSVDRGASQAFMWLMSIVTTAGLVSWIVICITYLRFFDGLREQGIEREALPYKSPLQPYLTYYALSMNVLIVLTCGWTSFVNGFDGALFLYNYLNCLLVPVAYLVLRRVLADTLVPLDEIDFASEITLIRQEQNVPGKVSEEDVGTHNLQASNSPDDGPLL